MPKLICPKCKSTNETDNKDECPNCGILYERYIYSRNKSFAKAITTIGNRGLHCCSGEFGKVSSQFPETKKLCDNYQAAINTALENYREGNNEKSQKIFTALLDKQPDLQKEIDPFLYVLKQRIDDSDDDSKKKGNADNAANDVTNSGVTNCKTCGKEVSQTAPACPHCGEQAPGLHIKCPKCNSMDIGSGKRGYKLGPASLIGTFTIGPAMLLCGLAGRKKIMLVCLDCNHKWKADKKYLATMNA